MTGYKPRKASEFIVPTDGHCFLCLNKVDEVEAQAQLKSDPSAGSSTAYLIQSLSQFLTLNFSQQWSKYLQDEGIIPVGLTIKPEMVNAKAPLCQNCIQRLETFSKLHDKLRKIEMEMVSCLELIYDKIVKANSQEQSEEAANSSFSAFGSRKRKLVEELRNETRLNCFRRLKAATPRVKIQKLTMKRRKKEGGKVDQCKSPLGIMEVYQQVLQKGLQKKQIRKLRRRHPDSDEDVDPYAPNEYEMDDFATPDQPINSDPDFTSEEEEMTPDSGEESDSHSAGSASTRSWPSREGKGENIEKEDSRNETVKKGGGKKDKGSLPKLSNPGPTNPDSMALVGKVKVEPNSPKPVDDPSEEVENHDKPPVEQSPILKQEKL